MNPMTNPIRIFLFAGFALLAPAALTWADTPPDWVSRFSYGAQLTSHMTGIVTDPGGVTYITGTVGVQWGVIDIFTAAVAPDGSTLWSHTFDQGGSDDQARGIGLGANGTVLVTGTTPGAMDFANVLVLKYDGATGALLDTIQFSNGQGISEHGESVVSDAQGNIYVTGGTVGDGGDVLTMKFSPTGNLLWQQAWDGPAWSPYSGDTGLQVLLDPQGDVVVLAHGMMASNQPDYVVIKYDGETGQQLWLINWGTNGGEYAQEMALDGAGDVYVTGIGIDFIDKYSTIKLRGSDGALLWQQYDALLADHSAQGIALDGAGGVYVTGFADPEGNRSNFNDNFFTVKRDAASGAFLWQHTFGENGVGQYDAAWDVIADSRGSVFVFGESTTAPYSADGLLFELDAATGAEIGRSAIVGASPEMVEARIVSLDAADNVFAGGEFYNANTGAVDGYVAGFARDGATMLKAPLAGVGIQWGTRLGGSRRSLENDDTNLLRIQSEVTGGGQKWVQVQVSARSPEVNPSRLDASILARVSMPGVTARLWLRNWETNRWVLLGSYSQGTTELLKEFQNIANPGAYVRDSDGLMQVRVRYSHVTDAFEALMDLVEFDILP